MGDTRSKAQNALECIVLRNYTLQKGDGAVTKMGTHSEHLSFAKAPGAKSPKDPAPTRQRRRKKQEERRKEKEERRKKKEERRKKQEERRRKKEERRKKKEGRRNRTQETESRKQKA